MRLPRLAPTKNPHFPPVVCAARLTLGILNPICKQSKGGQMGKRNPNNIHNNLLAKPTNQQTFGSPQNSKASQMIARA